MAIVTSKVAAACALLAGVIWVPVWLHHTRAHGTTSVNEMRLVLGLSWMDTAKVLPFVFLLLLPGLEVVIRRVKAHGGRRGGSASSVVVARAVQVCVVIAAIAGAVDYWTFPIASYAETFESRGQTFPVQFLACVVMSLGLVVLAVSRRHAGAGEWAPRPDTEPRVTAVETVTCQPRRLPTDRSRSRTRLSSGITGTQRRWVRSQSFLNVPRARSACVGSARHHEPS